MRDVAGALPIPEQAQHLWDAFCQLSLGRMLGTFAPQPLSYSDILAWAMLYGVALTPWDVDVIRSLDATALSYFIEKQKKDQPKPAGTPKRRPGRIR